jgi:hypothetical protein
VGGIEIILELLDLLDFGREVTGKVVGFEREWLFPYFFVDC